MKNPFRFLFKEKKDNRIELKSAVKKRKKIIVSVTDAISLVKMSFTEDKLEGFVNCYRYGEKIERLQYEPFGFVLLCEMLQENKETIRITNHLIATNLGCQLTIEDHESLIFIETNPKTLKIYVEQNQ